MASSELAHVHREKEKYKSKWLQMKESGGRKIESVVSFAETFAGGMIGGIMQGASKDPKGPHILHIPAELLIGGIALGVGATDLVGSGSKHLIDLGKGLVTAWGVDFGHGIGTRKKVTGRWFDHHPAGGALPPGGASPQAMADALLRQAAAAAPK
jgi:hypothetical protein